MNTSELRIGNYIEVLQDNLATPSTGARTVQYGIINSIDEEALKEFESEYYNPILINNYWLDRINAIFPFNDERIKIGNLHFKRTEIALVQCDENYNPITGKRLVSYVHQLQNLFFDANQRELDIKK